MNIKKMNVIPEDYYKLEKMCLLNENENEENYYLIDVFEFKSHTYIVLGSEINNDNTVEVEIMKFTWEVNDSIEDIGIEPVLEPITSDVELDEVQSYFYRCKR